MRLRKRFLGQTRFHAFHESGLSHKDWCQQNGIPPMTILLPEKIQIEVGADCPTSLMAILLQALNMLDFSGSTTVYLTCVVTDLRKSYTDLAVILQLQTHMDQDSPVGQLRILDPDKTTGPGRFSLAGYFG